jgi:hypothetical protein
MDSVDNNPSGNAHDVMGYEKPGKLKKPMSASPNKNTTSPKDKTSTKIVTSANSGKINRDPSWFQILLDAITGQYSLYGVDNKEHGSKANPKKIVYAVSIDQSAVLTLPFGPSFEMKLPEVPFISVDLSTTAISVSNEPEAKKTNFVNRSVHVPATDVHRNADGKP